MARKRVVFLAAVMLAFVPLAVNALGFGNIKLNSALNEPLNAEIELLSATAADVEGLSVKLASRDAFLRAGIDRPTLLGDLTFEIKSRKNGTYYIKASSKQFIREPFLNFLLEMNWPNGRMLREYTMLLDPPGRFQPQPAVIAAPQTQAPAVIGREEATPAEEIPSAAEPLAVPISEISVEEITPSDVVEDATDIEAELPTTPAAVDAMELEAMPLGVEEVEPRAEAEVQTVEPLVEVEQVEEVIPAEIELDQAVEELGPEGLVAEVEDVDPFIDDGTQFPRIPLSAYDEEDIELGALDYGITTNNDNAWTIAEKLRGSSESVSIYQVMMALLHNNPDAFVDGNVHRLKVGHVLRIDDPSLLMAMSKEQAANEYILQTDDWEAYRQSVAGTTSQQPIVASEVVTEVAQPEAKGELTLASPDGSSLQAGAGTAEEALSNDLAALQDELRQTKADSQTMRSRNTDLNARLRSLEQELAKMQRSISIKDDELAALQTQLAKLRQTKSQPKPAATTPVVEKAAAPAPQAVAPQPVVEPVQTAPAKLVEPPATLAPKPAAPAKPVVAPVEEPIQTLQPEQGIVDEFLDIAVDIFDSTVDVAAGMASSMAGNALLLYVGGPALLLLLILMLVIVQRRKKSEISYPESILSGGPSTVTSDETPSSDTASGESSFLSDFAVSGAGAIQTEDSEVDPLTEADVFMAYGRYEAAEERLQEAINQEPNRKELKVKLLELYNATKNQSAFENTAEDFYASLGGEAESDPLWEKVLAMGIGLAPSNPLFSGATVAEVASGALDDADVGLSDSQVMDIGLETGVFQADDIAAAAADTDVDFNLDLGDSDSQTAGGATTEDTTAKDTGLDFNLDMGFDTETNESLAVEAADTGLDFSLDTAPAEEPTADTGLDFNLDMDTDATEGTPTETIAIETDEGGLDFSLDMDMGGLAEDDSDQTMALDMGGLDFDAGGADLNLDASDAADVEMSAGGDEVGTKLDLAKAYIDMGDPEGARSILDEVMDEGNATQKDEAQQLMQQIA